MISATEKLTDCLEAAKKLLSDYPRSDFLLTDNADHSTQDLTLFERCIEFCNAGIPQEMEPVRLIQHLSCTGGTIISKCIAVMPNVVLLSEVNPASELPITSTVRFAPTDMIQLAKQSGIPSFDDLRIKLFRAEIAEVIKHTRNLGGRLVLRVHSHSDYLVGDIASQPNYVKNSLDGRHPLVSVMTVRHPIDSYLSLVQNNWIHFNPQTFDEYCRRYLVYLDHNQNDPLFKYEDFIYDPKQEIKSICKALSLPFNEDFMDLFELIKLTGESGRASNKISVRSKRKDDGSLLRSARNSSNYQKLCAQLDYDLFENS